MIWRNTTDRYGAVHKTLHWVIALCVLAMLAMGFFMGGIEDRVLRFKVYGVHKALGITVLALMALRLAWKLANLGRPRALPTHKSYERLAAGFVHWGFYALLIAMPLSGWLLTGAAGSTTNWFGLFVVPNIAEPNPALRALMSQAHDVMAWLILGFIGLHVAGALKHAVIDRDATLRRMLPFAAVALMALPAAAAAQDKGTEWVIDRAQSTLTFEGTQEGGAFSGRFGAFDGIIFFDPKKPQEGRATIIIDLASVDSRNAERDESVKDADWFDINNTPSATYTIERFEKSGKNDGEYLAIGRLSLRGIERPLDLPFTLTIEGKGRARVAKAVGQTTLKRLDFGVGGGQWADPAMVGDAFVVRIDITANAKDQ